MSVRIFLSYARLDDERFVRKLYEGLIAAGFDVWFDRISMPSRQLNFSAEIQAAISSCDRFVLIVGPAAVSSEYVMHEWRFAFHEALKCVNPILRRGDYGLLPEDLRGPHVEDFRDDSAFALHLASLIRQLSESVPPPGKLVAVPALPAHYFEQPDRIRAVRDMVIANLGKPVIVSSASGRVGLNGMGGIGKSLLANALARRLEIRREFPDGVFWVTLGQEPLIVELQRNIAKELGDGALFTTPEQGTERLRELLKDRAVLLILDDAWRREHADAFNMIGPRCRLLLTTRLSDLVTALAGKENHYQVQLPTAAEARAMLAKAAGIGSLNALPLDAASVIDECDRLPLALTLCGGMIQAGTSWCDLLEALRDHDLDFLSEAHPAEEHHANVWKAINVSVRALTDEERTRFSELAVFRPDAGAPEAAIETLWAHTAGLTPRYARKLLRALKERSLVEWDEAANRMTLHDLMYSFAAGMTPAASSLHHMLLDAYAKKCPKGWASGPNDGYFLESLVEHLVAAGRYGNAVALLKSAQWGLVKCGAGLVVSLNRDYSILSAEQPDETLSLIHRAVVLSLNALMRDEHLFAQQMVGRLSGLKELAVFLAELTAAAPRPWIRPLRASLASPRGPLLARLVGHREEITSLAVHPDGRHVVSGSRDGTIRIWDLNSGLCLRVIRGSFQRVWSVALTPDGRHIVAGTNCTSVCIHEFDTGICVQGLGPHETGVTRVVITSDGRFVCALSAGDLTVWDLSTAERVRTIRKADKAFEPDTDNYPGSRQPVALDGLALYQPLAIVGSEYVITGATDCGVLNVWDIGSGKCVRVLKGHAFPASAVSVTRDGSRVVSVALDLTLKVWNLATGRCVCSLDFPGDSEALSLVLTSDGRLCITGPSDAQIDVWDLDEGARIGSLGNCWSSVYAVAITPDDGVLVACEYNDIEAYTMQRGAWLSGPQGAANEVVGVHADADGRRGCSLGLDATFRTWDLSTGECLSEISHDKIPRSNASLGPVGFSLDGQVAVAVTKQNVLKEWNLKNGICRRLGEYGDYVGAITVLPDEQHVAAGSGEDINIWNLDTGSCVRKLTGHTNTVSAIAPGGRSRLLSGSSDCTVKAWNLLTGACEQTIRGHEGRVESVAFAGSSQGYAISSSYDGTVRVWDLKNGLCRQVLKAKGEIIMSSDGLRFACLTSKGNVGVWDVESGRLTVELPRRTGSWTPKAFSQGGYELIVVSESQTFAAEMWRISAKGTAKCVWKSKPGVAPPRHWRFSVEATLLATECGSMEREIAVWDIRSGKCLYRLEDNAHSKALVNGRGVVIFGSEDHALRIWDHNSTDKARIAEGHPDEIRSVLVAPNGRLAVTGSESGFIKIWDTKTVACQRSLKVHTGSVQAMVFCGDRYIFTGSDDQRIMRLDLHQQDGPEECERFSTGISHLLASARGDRLLVVLDDGTVALKDLLSGSVARLRAEGHPASVVAFTGDPAHIVTGANGHQHSATVRMWDVDKRRVMRNMQSQLSITDIGVSPDQRFVVAAGAGTGDEFAPGGEVFAVWDLNTGIKVAAFRGEVPARCMACSSSGIYLVGDYHGAVHVLELIDVV